MCPMLRCRGLLLAFRCNSENPPRGSTMIKFHSVALLAGISVLGSACGAPESEAQDTQQVSFEEFRASAYQEPESGGFVVDGDIFLPTESELREFYEQSVSGLGTQRGALAVYYSGGQDIKWSASQALNLTYCVSTKFGGNYTRVVNAMKSAAAEWEAASNVKFVHVSAQDSNCTNRNNNVVFDVNQTKTSQYLARAFFPNSARRSANVLISTTSFQNISPWTLEGVIRHELGHVLGFRHEHTRLTTTGCYEDSAWRALTPYDASSVMHYPQCNGTQTGDLVLTSNDRSGARALYP
ncbi:matrixin family metalloprotease [Myxococcus sp. AM009]|nr:matrixin family metalloprotease [Myxococcus sp. AM009]NVJ14342.1 matrixin family metalloprotease [Myxococcus sp. AM010]